MDRNYELPGGKNRNELTACLDKNGQGQKWWTPREQEWVNYVGKNDMDRDGNLPVGKNRNEWTAWAMTEMWDQ